MKRVSEVLQLPIVIEWRRSFSRESQCLEKLDFLLGRIAAEGRISKEVFEPRLSVERVVRVPFNKLKIRHGPLSQSAV